MSGGCFVICLEVLKTPTGILNRNSRCSVQYSSFIACTGTFNMFITPYVCLPRAKSPACHRSGVQLNVVKASTNRDFFHSIEAKRMKL